MRIETQEIAERKRGLGSWVTSIIIHVAFVLVMAFWILPALINPGRRMLSVQMGGDPSGDVVEILELRSDGLSESVSDAESVDDELAKLDIDAGLRQVDPLDFGKIEDLADDATVSLEWFDADPDEMAMEEVDSKRFNVDHPPRNPSSTDEIREVTDADGAVAVVTDSIRGELSQGNTLVVWLLDASISLVRNRALVADRMEGFYRSMDSFHTRKVNFQGSSLLMNAVVAYGATSMEIVRPNRFGARVCNALYKVPPDSTGLENVMTAVQKAAYYYRVKKKRRERIIFVVITDESGDDTTMLEPTINFCRYSNIAVHIIGPTAVFGAERGSHLWNAQGSNGGTSPFLLPVKRGPDTSLPERAFLPYWHESLLPPWQKKGIVPASSVKWYGGAYRERVLSGVGPYALTRLALMTGGTFTILDRRGDEGRFRLNAMRDYLPSYDSPLEYLASVKSSPLRHVVSETALLSHTSIDAFIPPRMAYLGGLSTFYPYNAIFRHIHPITFRSRLKPVMAAEQKRVMQMYRVLQQALRAFDQPSIDWEYEYAREESKRWKAWYDLTKGRLLSLCVRCLEYNAACELIHKNLAPDTNKLVLLPWNGKLRVPRSETMATEAERLLQRCCESNPDTPWQALAQWELNEALSIQFRQEYIPPPPPPPPTPPTIGLPMSTAKPQTFTFPNL